MGTPPATTVASAPLDSAPPDVTASAAPAASGSAAPASPAPSAPMAPAAPKQPPAHLRAAATWLVMAIQASAVSLLLKPFTGNLPDPIPVLLTVTLIVPLGVYLTIPFTVKQFARLASRR